MTLFSELGLAEPLLKALESEGYTTPTPIQEQTIPHLLEGRDMLGLAQTGTGKTASFALPILQRLDQIKQRAMPKSTRVLVLTPTRELAVQVGQSFKTYGCHYRLRHALVFGGVGMVPQIKSMAGGVDILVATPGRLLDLMNQGAIRLDSVEVLVLDEADRMLDMGFILPIRKIVAAIPKSRQTVLFSATMPETIVGLADSVLHRPVKVEVTPAATTVEKIDQKVMFVDRENKRTLLAELLGCPSVGRALVFTRTKHGANRVAELLEKEGITADAIHGNKSQGARQKALADFRDGRIKALVATDIAARGIDVDGVTHVINFELPNEPESYVHRIGRTARAGASGIALSLCDAEEVSYLRAIEKTIRQAVPVDYEHAFHAPHIASRGSGKPKPRVQAPRPPQARPQAGRGGNPHGEHAHAAKPGGHGHGGAGRPAQSSSRPAQGGKPQGKPGFKGLPGGGRTAARG
ncbi:DEAD/DEAH box helicase [Paramagnetospirillum marisnigri]|uniref:DEAD-box ATP-dependent RNA helicase RhpA n=1 Tax=Paramagnetospirillum marisnigri TaxID=1285242 RepID=A0A178MD11_9PROT|nr:DEAD/DEAH box helicase [Paramagnetospirillum marisnigri]OAN46700.1 DEAD/DEAH box helicase [Paramagnetospirillum marisnigri]